MKRLMKNFAILIALVLFLGTVGLDVQAAAAMNNGELLNTESITNNKKEEPDTGGDQQPPEDPGEPGDLGELGDPGEPGEGDPEPGEPGEGDPEPGEPEGDPDEGFEEENEYVELFPSPELYFPPTGPLAARFALFSNPLLDPGETSFSKTAEPVPGYVNTWKVTLDMSARDTQVSSDIVLVIDASTSMNSGGKLAAAKAAAVQFVETLLNGDYPNTRIALVRFGTGVEVLLGGSFYGPSAANITTLKNAINGISISGTQYTHTQAAIRQAHLLLDGTPSTGTIKNIVLLSDGEPTRSYALKDESQDSGNFPSSGNTRYNFNNLSASKYDYNNSVGASGNMWTRIGNSNRYYHHGNSAEGQAKMAKDSGKIIYTIALNVSEAGQGVLQRIASPNKNYTGSATDLNAIFADIAGSISSAMSAVTVVDNMGPGMEIPAHRVASITTTQGTATYDAASRTINWNLGGALNKVTGDPTLRYAKLEYIVEINDDILTAAKYDALSGGSPSATGIFYDTNGITAASYTDANGGLQTHNYISPRVDPVFYTVEKVLTDSSGQPYPAGDDRSFVIRVAGPDGYSRDHTVKHGETLTLTSLRREGTYTVSEISVSGTPASQLSDYIISYKVNGLSASSFTLAQGNADIAIVVTNEEIVVEPVDVVIEGTKSLIGRGLGNGEFSFNLYESDAQGVQGSLLKTAKNVGANFAFTALTFEDGDEGSYYYLIKESTGSFGGVQYDDTRYLVKVVISDGGGGQLVSAVTYMVYKADEGKWVGVNGAAYTNIYTATGSFTPAVTKVLTGRDLQANEFSFILEEMTAAGPPAVWNEVETKKNLADGTIPFGAINYTLADVGIHTYRIRELASGLAGVTDDTLVVSYVVTVSDKGDGTLNVAYSPPNDTIFNNVYAASGNFTPLVTKVLSGRVLKANEFTFVLEKLEAGSDPEVWNEVETKTNLADGSIPFSAINYGLADVGVHTYRITEQAPVPAGVIRDLLVVTYTVEVSDNGDGTLTVSYDTPNDTEFNNLYTATGSFTPSVTKVLSGRALKANEFTFVLEKLVAGSDPAVWNEVETKTNLANGTIPFSALNYTLADVGIHTYRITEQASGLAGVTDDTLIVSYVVTVSDQGNGTLNVAYSTPNDTVFNNTYQAEGIDLDLGGIKTLEGRELVDGEFSFSLYESDVSGVQGNLIETVTNDGGYFEFSVLTFGHGDQGTYYYLIKEVVGTLGGVDYDLTEYLVKVVISDDLAGAMKIDELTYMVFIDEEEAWLEVEGLAFNNTYESEGIDLDLGGIKTLEGRALVDGEFSFSLYESDASGLQGNLIETVTNDGGYFEFSILTFGHGDQGTYYYLIKEVEGTLGGVDYDLTEHLVKVVISDDLAGAMEIDELTYMVFIDEEEAWLEVEGLAFNNTYQAEGIDLDLDGIKTLEGRALVDGEFSFNLYESDASGVQGNLIETVTNDGGYFEFSVLTFGHGDQGTYYYLIKEVEGTLGGVDYDLTEYLVKVVIVDDLEGAMEIDELTYMVFIDEEEAWLEVEAIAFNNTYEAEGIDLDLDGIKTLEGRALVDGEFSFSLYESDASGVQGNLIETVTNDGGYFEFSVLTFGHGDQGTYYYLIKEVEGTLGGVDYDLTEYLIKVVIVDDLAGAMEIDELTYMVFVDEEEAWLEVEAIAFNNTYQAEGIDLDLGGIKTLEGRALVDGEFSFSLYESDASGVQGNLIETVTNDGGYFEFTTLTFGHGDQGTYYYLIKEVEGTLGGVDYDLTEYLIKVVIVDDLAGAMEIDELTYMVFVDEEEAWLEVEAIAFNNTYQAEGIDLDLDGIKTLEGRALVDGEFSFSLYESDASGVQGNLIETVTNDGGYFEFSVLTFGHGDQGTYYYLIKEVEGTLGGVDYDLTEYLIKVVIVDDLAGAMEIDELTYMVFVDEEEAWLEVEAIAFNNTYQAEGIDLDLDGIKTLEGRALVDGEFSFSLYESDASGVQGNLIETVTNDGGYFEFTTLTFGHGDQGTYYYLIKEVVGTLSHVTYDLTEYLVRVVISDNLEGAMQVDELTYMLIGSEVEEGWQEAEIAVFNNRYIPPPPPPALVPDLEVEKLVEETVFSKAGDKLHYSVRIKNTGDLAFVKLTINDARLGIANLEIDLSADPLLPGETYLHVFTAPYIVTEADVDAAAAIINTLTVKGETAGGKTAEDNDDALVPFEQTAPAIPPILKLVKMAKETKFTKAGNLIHYYFTVTNEGMVAVVKLTVNDPKLGINNLIIDLKDDPLMPGESFTYEFSQAYLVTKADVDAGKIKNVLTVTGESPEGLKDEAKDDLIVPYEQILPLPPTGEHVNSWPGIAALLLGGAVALILIIRRRNLKIQNED